MFSKEILEEIKLKTKEINKMKTFEERVSELSNLRDSLYLRINDEVDELLSNINLKNIKKD